MGRFIFDRDMTGAQILRWIPDTSDTERPSCPNVPRRDGTFTTEHESGFYCDVCGDITV
jgi:hypothetical protein